MNNLKLVPFAKEHIPLKIRWVNDPANNRFLHYQLPLTYENTERWFDKVAPLQGKSRLDCTILFNDKPVGLVGLLDITEGNSAEGYILVDHSVAGKGIAPQAIALSLADGFDRFNLREIIYYTEEGNHRAQKAFEKTGLFVKGELVNKGNYRAYRYIAMMRRNRMHRLLFLSCGTRNKLLQGFKKTFGSDGYLIGADNSPYAPALYECDKAVLTPRYDSKEYLPFLLELCKKEQVNLVLSLIDPELELLAIHRAEIEATGAKVMISDPKLVSLTFDKLAFARAMETAGIPTTPTFESAADFCHAVDKGKVTFPAFVKPRCGSASVSIQKVEGADELRELCSHNADLIVQPFMAGKEYGVDCFFDMDDGTLIGCFIKEKLKMRAGETDKSISRCHEGIFALIQQVAQAFSFRGTVDMDVFETADGIYLSEINPRFGGGYPHAYAAGADYPALLKNWLEGKKTTQLTKLNYDEGLVMMKYNDLCVMQQSNLVTKETK